MPTMQEIAEGAPVHRAPKQPAETIAAALAAAASTPALRTALTSSGFEHTSLVAADELAHVKATCAEEGMSPVWHRATPDNLKLPGYIMLMSGGVVSRETSLRRHDELTQRLIGRKSSRKELPTMRETLQLPAYDTNVPSLQRDRNVSYDMHAIETRRMFEAPRLELSRVVDPRVPVDPILAVGFEIEGLWANRPERHIDFPISPDGSVCDDRSEHERSVNPMSMRGEVRMGPYAQGNMNVRQAAQVAHFYPHYINATCGLHVHISLINSGLYAAYVCKEFYDWFLTGLERWRHARETSGGEPRYVTFWDRIAGNNEFCRREYTPANAESQMGITSRTRTPRAQFAGRYNAINYCRSRHGTIEVRVLNAFHTAEECISAVGEVVKLFRIWGLQFTSMPRDVALFGAGGNLQLPANAAAPDLNAWVDTRQFSLPLQVGQIRNVITLNDDSEVIGHALTQNLLCINERYVVRTQAVSRRRTGTCLCNFGVRRYECGCEEWCRYCQTAQYRTQGEHHGLPDSNGICWRTNGYSWSVRNCEGCGVPSRILTPTILAQDSSDHCPLCEVPSLNHHNNPQCAATPIEGARWQVTYSQRWNAERAAEGR